MYVYVSVCVCVCVCVCACVEWEGFNFQREGERSLTLENFYSVFQEIELRTDTLFCRIFLILKLLTR